MPSLSTTGLLQFNPNGFDYSRSLSNTMPGVNGLETFLMDPMFNGFSGDMMCMNIILSEDDTPSRLQPGENVNSIMPMIWLNNEDQYNTTVPTYPTDIGVLSCSAVGIAVSFKWYPAGGNGTTYVEKPIFTANTPLYPGTFVEVTVLTDPFAVYTAQTNTPVAAGGMTPMYTGVNSWYIGSPTVAYYTLNSIRTGTSYSLPFTMGELTGSNAGSRQYLYNLSYGSTITGKGNVPFSVNPQQPANALSIGLTKGIEGNRMTLAGGPTYPYIYYDVIMQNPVWGYQPPMTANPA